MRSVVSPIAFPPQGRPGAPGAPAVQTGFGQITYTERTTGPEDIFPANTRQQLLFTPDLALTQNFLRDPFVGHAFWVGNKVVPRTGGMGDFLDLIVNLLVTAQTAGGDITLDLDVGSLLGPTGSLSTSLQKPALTQERVTFRIGVQVLGNFLANGLKLYLTPTVNVTVLSEAVVVLPLSLGPTPP